VVVVGKNVADLTVDIGNHDLLSLLLELEEEGVSQVYHFVHYLWSLFGNFSY
jgi:hypothetical protein